MASVDELVVVYGLLLGLVAVLAVRWAYRMITGTPVSFGALVGFSVFYILVFLYAALNSLQTLDTWFLLPLLAILLAMVYLSAPHIERVVRFEVRADGRWYFRLGMLLPLLYILVLVLRLVENLYLLRIDPFQLQPPPAAPLGSATARILFTSNALFAAGTGFLLGRNLGVHRAYVRARAQAARPSYEPGAS